VTQTHDERTARRAAPLTAARLLAAAWLIIHPTATMAQAGQPVTGSLTLYGWLPSVEADIATTSGGVSDSASFSASDLLADLDFAAFATAEVRQGRIGALLDVAAMAVSNGETLGGPFSTRVDGDVSLLLVTTAATYRVYENGGTYADILAGGRFNRADLGITTRRAVPVETSRAAGADRAWFDPLVGVRVGAAITDRIAVMALADIGGFGVGSDLTYELLASASYAITPGIKAVAGFRYLAIDYDSDRVKLDLRAFGPAIGLTIGF
jgi:hypothetical protein